MEIFFSFGIDYPRGETHSIQTFKTHGFLGTFQCVIHIPVVITELSEGAPCLTVGLLAGVWRSFPAVWRCRKSRYFLSTSIEVLCKTSNITGQWENPTRNFQVFLSINYSFEDCLLIAVTFIIRCKPVTQNVYEELFTLRNTNLNLKHRSRMNTSSVAQ